MESDFKEFVDYTEGRTFLFSVYSAYTAPYHKGYDEPVTLDILTPGFTEIEQIQAAIQAYSGNAHVRINNYLRRPWNNNPYWDIHISCLTQLINEAPRIPQNIIVYRGIKGEFFDELMASDVGETKCIKGFLSSSLSKDRAFSYGRIIKIYVRAGAKAVALDTAWDKSDNELLFLPGRDIEKKGEETNHDDSIDQDIIPVFKML